jgi:hypothetical protein
MERRWQRCCVCGLLDRGAPHGPTFDFLTVNQKDIPEPVIAVAEGGMPV